MSLIQNIQSDLTKALKAGDTKTKDILRFIVSQLKYKEIELKRDSTDDEVLTAIRKQIRELEEVGLQYSSAGRADLATENAEQAEILKKYLPVEIGDEELEKLVRAFIDGNRDAYIANPKALTGKIVGALRSKASPSRIAACYGKIAT